jgi:hypothetical protein
VQQDLAGVTAAIDTSRTDLEAVDYAPAKLRPDALVRLTSPEIVLAMSRIEAWTKDAC